MDKFEMRAIEQRNIMITIGIGMLILGMLFDLGVWSGMLIGFGSITVILNLVMNIYKIRKL